jgi:hypothetical protein
MNKTVCEIIQLDVCGYPLFVWVLGASVIVALYLIRSLTITGRVPLRITHSSARGNKLTLETNPVTKHANAETGRRRKRIESSCPEK